MHTRVSVLFPYVQAQAEHPVAPYYPLQAITYYLFRLFLLGPE